MKKRILFFTLVIISLVVAFTACRQTVDAPLSATELLVLGEKYLLELNFEQAIVHFTNLIEIEPKNPRGYTGLAEAHLGLGDVARAIAALEQGLMELPGNAEIQALLDELSPPEEVSKVYAHEPEPADDPAPELTEPESIEFEPDVVQLATGSTPDPVQSAQAEPTLASTEPAPTESTLTEPESIPASPPESQPTPTLPQNANIEYITIRGRQYNRTLTRLDLNNHNLRDEDIVYLRYMTDLTHLWLTGNQISDLSPLSGLTNLRELYLSNNQISDLTPLSGLTNLRILSLGRNQISDLAPLSGLTNLTNLWLDSNQISDLTPLSGLTNLRTGSLSGLNLRNNPITDWSPVAHVFIVDGRPSQPQ
jgi:Leucine-rich repeat (LRR) protein